VKLLRKRQRAMPSVDPDDPGYRRLRYIRYADDHLLGFAGPKAEAEEIKQQLAQFLRDNLMLDLSADKTLITHAAPGQRDSSATRSLSSTTTPRPHWAAVLPTAASGSVFPRQYSTPSAPSTSSATANPCAGLA